MAGPPIRGKSLRLSPLSVGTSIRRTDSLEQGRSGFYTEIQQIRRVFKLTEEATTLLFLFDELLEGTNSKDRRIGAEGLLKALLNQRSEEHTSELQSRLHLVCRLLLEKKKKNTHNECMVTHTHQSNAYI